MNKYLPSKKFSLILLSLIMALGIIWGFPHLIKRLKSHSTTNQPSQVEIKNKVQAFMALDTDSDGLKDWEEALWKTDPKKDDTDGDGTNDNEEISTNRDPLRANTAGAGKEPNDKIDEKIIADNKKVADDFAQLSDTDKMGRLLFSQYLATKKVDQTLSQTDIASIVQNTLIDLPQISFKQHLLTEIIVNPVSNSETIKQYGNDITKVMMTDLFAKNLANQNYDFYGLAEIKNILQLIQGSADQTSINQAFAKLNPIVNQYGLLINDLLKTAVPGHLAQTHLTLINAFEFVHDNLRQIQKASSNIVTLPLLLSNHSKNINNLWTVIGATGKVFVDNKIVFTPTDFGSQLFSGIMTNK